MPTRRQSADHPSPAAVRHAPAPLVAAAVLLLAAALLPAPAAAQEVPPPEPGEVRPPAPPARWWLGARLGAFEMVNAADSYDAVFGDPMPQLGLAAEVDLRRRWRVALSVDYGTVDGERVLLADPPIGTGVEETLTLIPVHLTVGWRLRPEARWDVWLGAGPSLLSWEDESDFDSTSGTDFGASAALGLRRGDRRSPWTWGAELRWSTFPNTLPDAGVAGAYGEDDPGGLAVTLTALRRLR